jgi:hypothetical protein
MQRETQWLSRRASIALKTMKPFMPMNMIPAKERVCRPVPWVGRPYVREQCQTRYDMKNSEPQAGPKGAAGAMQNVLSDRQACDADRREANEHEQAPRREQVPRVATQDPAKQA